ncbi:MAG: prephenate dehydratase, partial [Bacteroidota bacterium]
NDPHVPRTHKMREHDLRIVGEVSIRIRHCLLAYPGVRLSDIRQVHSHPQAIGQCREWLRRHLPRVELTPAYDTAGAAARLAASQTRDTAAIASIRAGTEYGLDILAEGIESNPNNYTRFLALSRPEDIPPLTGEAPCYKTTILYSLIENLPGALFKTLAVFSLRDIDLLKIESRPLVGSPGKYIFYVDVAGQETDEPLERALEHLTELTTNLTVLGTYPCGSVAE